MDTFRLRPKDNYINEALWEDLYVLTEHWKSDFDFYNDELLFLSKLVGKYFIWLVNDKNIKVVESLSADLSLLTKENETLSNLCLKHLRHIEEFIENPFSHDIEKFKAEHEKLEDNIVQFVKKIKSLKKEIFKVTERVIEEEKLSHLLSD